MAQKTCRVTISDMDGIDHTAHVVADTLYEAVARGIVALKANGWTGDGGKKATTRHRQRSGLSKTSRRRTCGLSPTTLTRTRRGDDDARSRFDIGAVKGLRQCRRGEMTKASRSRRMTLNDACSNRIEDPILGKRGGRA